MNIQDTEAAIRRLLEFRVLVRAYGIAKTYKAHNLVDQRAALMKAEPTAVEIIRAIDGAIDLTWQGRPLAVSYVGSADDAVNQALGLLEDVGVIEQIIGPQGPRLAASQLHATVWSAAAHLWDDGHHAESVQRASTAVVQLVRDRTGRHDVSSETSLMQLAFSEKAPLLVWPDDTTATGRSMRDGLRFLAPGLLMTVRNPVTHSTAPISPQAALERLAALSMLAHFIDGCEPALSTL